MSQCIYFLFLSISTNLNASNLFWSCSRAKTSSYLYWNLTSRPIMPLWWHTLSGKVQTPSSSHAYSLLCRSYHSAFMRVVLVTSPLEQVFQVVLSGSNKKEDISQGWSPTRPVVREHQVWIIILGGDRFRHQTRGRLAYMSIPKNANRGRWDKQSSFQIETDV